jgi:hypothetical protein
MTLRGVSVARGMHQGPVMHELPNKGRLAATAAVCSAMVMVAGLIALQGTTGIAIASVLLTGALIEALVGSAYSSDRRLGVGILALIAAGFPLFVGLYVIGLQIFKRMGAGVAGGLLIGLGAGLALTALGLWLLSRRKLAHSK